MENSLFEETASLFEENFKKAVTELLILVQFTRRDCYIGELADHLLTRSNGVLSIVFPYAAIYRLLERGYLEEAKKRIAPDGRRRQYYRITDAGRTYLQALKNSYGRMTTGISAILSEEGEHDRE
ncbi:MAG: helix-turn-helix transcriptional regulator [Oscillospiraceae bacterium]|nr:helix-turn-helix transcriptional regulator [Oscillospiraceae bacterium]